MAGSRHDDDVQFVVTIGGPPDGDTDGTRKRKRKKKQKRDSAESTSTEAEVVNLVTSDDSVEEQAVARGGKKRRKTEGGVGAAGGTEGAESSRDKEEVKRLLSDIFDPQGATNGLAITICSEQEHLEALFECTTRGKLTPVCACHAAACVDPKQFHTIEVPS